MNEYINSFQEVNNKNICKLFSYLFYVILLNSFSVLLLYTIKEDKKLSDKRSKSVVYLNSN